MDTHDSLERAGLHYISPIDVMQCGGLTLTATLRYLVKLNTERAERAAQRAAERPQGDLGQALGKVSREAAQRRYKGLERWWEK